MDEENDNPWEVVDIELALKLMGKSNGQGYDFAVMNHIIDWAKDHYTCNRPPGAAGALLMTEQHFIYTGVYPPDNSPTCKEIGCEIEYSALATIEPDGHFRSLRPHCVRTIHAEQRAIFIAARLGIATMGATIYSILKPCYDCSKAIAAAGIARIYYAGAAYNEQRTIDVLDRANVECLKINVGLEYGQ